MYFLINVQRLSQEGVKNKRLVLEKGKSFEIYKVYDIVSSACIYIKMQQFIRERVRRSESHRRLRVVVMLV